MKLVRHGMAASLLIVPALCVAAPSLDLQYSTFYSQMKTFAKGEFGRPLPRASLVMPGWGFI